MTGKAQWIWRDERRLGLESQARHLRRKVRPFGTWKAFGCVNSNIGCDKGWHLWRCELGGWISKGHWLYVTLTMPAQRPRPNVEEEEQTNKDLPKLRDGIDGKKWTQRYILHDLMKFPKGYQCLRRIHIYLGSKFWETELMDFGMYVQMWWRCKNQTLFVVIGPRVQRLLCLWFCLWFRPVLWALLIYVLILFPEMKVFCV